MSYFSRRHHRVTNVNPTFFTWGARGPLKKKKLVTYILLLLCIQLVPLSTIHYPYLDICFQPSSLWTRSVSWCSVPLNELTVVNPVTFSPYLPRLIYMYVCMYLHMYVLYIGVPHRFYQWFSRFTVQVHKNQRSRGGDALTMMNTSARCRGIWYTLN